MGFGDGAAVPRHRVFIEGAVLLFLHRGTFTNTNSINKHDLARLAVKTKSSHFPGPVLYYPVITRVSRSFQVSIISFPSTPALPPSQISESCWLYFYLFSAALQVGDANPCSSWAAGVLCSLRNVTECFSLLLLPCNWFGLKNLNVGDNGI